jgi:integrase
MNVDRRRRGRRGAAWHWKQTDCWYYTPPGAKKRVALRDEAGNRIRGAGNKQSAALALARVKLTTEWQPAADTPALQSGGEPWLVARVCSEHIQHCASRSTVGFMNAEYLDEVNRYLNDLCKYCGGLPVAELKKGHVQLWVDGHSTWRSPVTRRNAIAIVLAAFNFAQSEHGVRSPLKGMKKPPSRPRLASISPEDEQTLYTATDARFKDFLYAAIHTGLRPFCELALLSADHVEETDRGMMWRVYSSKTKKTRKIPVRPDVAKVVRRLLRTAPKGSGKAIFRNAKGDAWKSPTAKARFRALRARLNWDGDAERGQYSCYTCRHTFAHRMLSGYWNGGAGCSIEVLAELMGNTPKVAFDHYGKQWGQQYQEPLWAAIGESTATQKASNSKQRSR